MATFRKAAWHPFLLVLLTAILEESFGKKIPTPSPGILGECEIEECIRSHGTLSISCKDIVSIEMVEHAQQVFEIATQMTTGYYSIQLDIRYCDLELFPDNFFKPYRVEAIEFHSCDLTEIPHRLITPLKGTLKKLDIHDNPGLKSISDEEFSDYMGLQHIDLGYNGIEQLSPIAFDGLDELKHLNLRYNYIKNLHGLEGIPELMELDLSNNNISYVNKNFFRKLTKLESIYLDNNNLTTLEKGIFDKFTSTRVNASLQGNPLNCNCSLTWLKDWFKDHDVVTLATCGPEKNPLQDMNISYCMPEQFLEIAINRAIATLRPETTCDCQVKNYIGGDEWIRVECTDINSTETVQCAQQYLRKVTTIIPDFQTSISIKRCHTKVFPDNFFAPYRVAALELSGCNVTEIPHRLITPVCDTLSELTIRMNYLLKTINEEEFINCTGLQALDLASNGIEELSPIAFYNLNQLERLNLEDNNISSFNGLKGIPELKDLFLSDNSIKHVDKHAFRKLRNIKTLHLDDNKLTTLEEGTFDPLTNIGLHISLQGNPLNCNCSLKWLQDWVKENDSGIPVTCGREEIPLDKIYMIHCTPAGDSSTADTSMDNPQQESESSTRTRIINCDCNFKNDTIGWISVECKYITRIKSLICAESFLDLIIRYFPNSKLELTLRDCDLDLFPNDFLMSQSITNLELSSCNIIEIPQQLIAPACDTLNKLTLSRNYALKTIREGAFSQCKGLQTLDLSFNGIEEISPLAFYGLDNLEKLFLEHNNITSFNGLKWAPKLQLLYLSYSGVRYVDKNAFQYLTTLETIYLDNNNFTTLEEGTFDMLSSELYVEFQGNSLNCNCSLKWLQDWINENDTGMSIICNRGPKQITLQDMNMSHCPPANSLKKSYAEDVPKQRQGILGNCERENYTSGDKQISIACEDITTNEKAELARLFLEIISKIDPDCDIHLNIRDSDLDVFPDDFFEHHRVTTLAFYSCNINEIPRNLIAYACKTLVKISICNNQGLITLRENEFRKCTSLQHVDLAANGIEEMSPMAFYGLNKLNNLQLEYNNIVRFYGLKGTPQLKHLDLSDNRIKYIDKNAFWGLSNLNVIQLENNNLTTLEEGTFHQLTSSRVFVELRGNPLNCNCSLEWLQDWSSDLKVDLKTNCVPDDTSLQKVNLSHCKPASTSTRNAVEDIQVPLTTLPEEPFQGEMTSTSLNNAACDCETSKSFCDDIRCNAITCNNIDSDVKVQCAQQHLNHTATSAPGMPLRAEIYKSYLDLFPDNFFASYPVISLSIQDCDLTKIPMRLINPTCDTLTNIFIQENRALKIIPEGEFNNCTGLQYLNLGSNGIQELSSTVFSGLNKLVKLVLYYNKFTTFNGLEGMPSLTYIDLKSNNISYLDKNAFQNLRDLNQIYLGFNNITTLEKGTFDPLTSAYLFIDLEGNPLNCNCSLKWLQDLSKLQHSADISGAFCGPKRIQDVIMSNCDSPGQATRIFLTDFAVFTSVLMFGLTWFTNI